MEQVKTYCEEQDKNQKLFASLEESYRIAQKQIAEQIVCIKLIVFLEMAIHSFHTILYLFLLSNSILVFSNYRKIWLTLETSLRLK